MYKIKKIKQKANKKTIKKENKIMEQKSIETVGELHLLIKDSKHYGGKLSYDAELSKTWLIDAVEFTILIQQNGQIGIIGLVIGDISVPEKDSNIIQGVITKSSAFYDVYYQVSSNIQLSPKLN